MKRTGLTTRYWLATLALICLIWAAPAGLAQSTTPASTDDLTQRQLTVFDQFLDNHPELAEQLRKNPSLVNNEEFVENHPALQQFLTQHPGVREDLTENPSATMHQENRFDRREDPDRDRDVNRGELANMDRFMDSHPEIAEQLKKNPSLVNNKEFVESHPELQQFLAQHPGVREEIRENPSAFMASEQRFDRREDSRDRDVTRGELANMDRFLDSHPEIAERLQKDPSLVNNKDFVEDHAALKEFLANHPELREEFKENPNAFMRQENRFDRREDGSRSRDNDVTRGELASFHEFLEDHGNIASELEKKPWLANNSEYLQNHTALQAYLQANPQVREELHENPSGFIKSTQSFDTNAPGGMKTMPKPMTPDPLKKQ
jgi:phage-related protein